MDEKIVTNNLVVDINLVQPNDYNPKINFRENPENLAEFEKIKESINLFGQVQPIIVRELDGGRYEIINGFHRWSAMVELGFTKIEIKNLGKIEFDEAIAIALQTEDTKVPIDKVELANLLNKLVTVDKDAEYWAQRLPYTAEIIKNKIELINFDWNQFGGEGGDNQDAGGDGETVKFHFKVSGGEDAEDCHNALNSTGQELDAAFVEICQFYLNFNKEANDSANPEKDEDGFLKEE